MQYLIVNTFQSCSNVIIMSKIHSNHVIITSEIHSNHVIITSKIHSNHVIIASKIHYLSRSSASCHSPTCFRQNCTCTNPWGWNIQDIDWCAVNSIWFPLTGFHADLFHAEQLCAGSLWMMIVESHARKLLAAVFVWSWRLSVKIKTALLARGVEDMDVCDNDRLIRPHDTAVSP